MTARVTGTIPARRSTAWRGIAPRTSARRTSSAVNDRVRAVRRAPSEFAGAHVAPSSSADVADEQRVRVVVLGVDCPHKRTSAETRQRWKFVADIFENRGNSPRLYRNMLVFIAADEDDAGALNQSMRDFLAWDSIRNEEEQLNLDAQQRHQVETNLKRAYDAVELRVRTAYSWLIVPVQPEPMGKVEFQATRITGEDSFYTRALRRLAQNDELVTTWAPTLLQLAIRDFDLWKGKSYLSLKQLWEYLTSYCYMPRLLDQGVLIDAIEAGIRQLVETPFGYADRVDDRTGRFERLLFRSSDAIYFNDSCVLVHPDAADGQIREDEARRKADEEASGAVSHPAGGGGVQPAGGAIGKPKSGPRETVHTRYHGSVRVNPTRVTSDVGMIVDEVLQHLTSLTGCEVDITVEISAHRRDGFDPNTMRTVSENSRTLKFNDFGFEEI